MSPGGTWAFPHLGVLVLIDDWPVTDRYPTAGVLAQMAKNLGLACPCTGVVAAFWHVWWPAGVVVLVSGIGAFVAYTTFISRVWPQPDASGGPKADGGDLPSVPER